MGDKSGDEHVELSGDLRVLLVNRIRHLPILLFAAW
jgi:hypothetical protein